MLVLHAASEAQVAVLDSVPWVSTGSGSDRIKYAA